MPRVADVMGVRFSSRLTMLLTDSGLQTTRMGEWLMTVAVKRKRLLPSARFIGRPQIVSNTGYCVTCDSDTTFRSASSWLRDGYVCAKCGSIPGERALMVCIERDHLHWRDLSILEASPSLAGASAKLKKTVHTVRAHCFLPRLPAGGRGIPTGRGVKIWGP